MAALIRRHMFRRVVFSTRTDPSSGRERGAELVEFAFILPVLLLILVGIIDFAFLFQKYEVVTNAAREGARVGVLFGYDDADVEVRARQYLSAAGLDPALGTYPAPTRTTLNVNGSQVRVITVTVRYPHNFVFLAPFAAMFGGTFGTIDLVGRAAMRTEAQGSN